MPDIAAASSLSKLSPENPTAPRRTLSASRTRTPPGTGTIRPPETAFRLVMKWGRSDPSCRATWSRNRPPMLHKPFPKLPRRLELSRPAIDHRQSQCSITPGQRLHIAPTASARGMPRPETSAPRTTTTNSGLPAAVLDAAFFKLPASHRPEALFLPTRRAWLTSPLTKSIRDVHVRCYRTRPEFSLFQP